MTKTGLVRRRRIGHCDLFDICDLEFLFLHYSRATRSINRCPYLATPRAPSSLNIMNILDFILLTILAAALIRGFVRGMIRQVAGLLGLLTGFVVAGHLYLQMLPVLRRHFPSAPYLEVLSYVVIYASAWLAVVFLGYLFVKLSRAMLMAWADRLLGGAFGLFKGMVAAVVLVAVLTLFLPSKSRILGDSLLSVHVQKVGYYLVRLTPKELRDRYQKSHEVLVRQLQQQQMTDSIKKKIKK